MRTWRSRIWWLAALLVAVMLAGDGFIFGGGAVAQAAPATQASATVAEYGVPHETSKLVLPETSPDGPALWTQRGQSAPMGPLAVLAWTGTDHRLNFEYTNDGKTFTDKTTLNETSLVRPAVLRGAGEGMVAPIALAWTGTDVGRRLNVLYIPYEATPMKLTLPSDTSFTSPTIEWLTGDTNTLLLVWAGTDQNHSLNTLPISITSTGLVAGTKTTLWSYHSVGQPAITPGLSVTMQTRFLLSWSDLTNHHIMWATSTDGKTWAQQATFPESSGSAPSMMGLIEQLVHMPPYWLGWTGTDAARHVNVLYALDFSQWTRTYEKTTLPETAVGGTVVGFVLGLPGEHILVAWTGTDAAHHLNVAMVGV